MPSEQIRQWRDLTRQRTKLLDQRTSVINRIHKTLEGCNLKLSTVASDVMGVSGRAMLKALSEGEQNAETLAEMARGTLKNKYAELVESLEGRVSEHHQWMLGHLLKQVTFLEEEIAAYAVNGPQQTHKTVKITLTNTSQDGQLAFRLQFPDCMPPSGTPSGTELKPACFKETGTVTVAKAN